MINTLSFNVTTDTRGQVEDVARDVKGLLHDAGCAVGQFNHLWVSDGVANVHMKFHSEYVYGPVLLEAIRKIRRLPMVDAVKTL